MNLLMIDTSGPACGVALLEDGRLIYESVMVHRLTHSERLMPMVDTALRMTEREMGDIDVFGAVTGPGSFTGVRIGVSTVKGLAHACGKPVIGVDALEALAQNAPFFDGCVAPVLDARAQQVYTALFSGGERIMEDRAMKLSELLDILAGRPERVMLTGDGMEVCRAAAKDALGERVVFAPAGHQILRAGLAGALAFRRITDGASLGDYLTLQPLYLRAPQAERERAKREGRRIE